MRRVTFTRLRTRRRSNISAGWCPFFRGRDRLPFPRSWRLVRRGCRLTVASSGETNEARMGYVPAPSSQSKSPDARESRYRLAGRAGSGITPSERKCASLWLVKSFPYHCPWRKPDWAIELISGFEVTIFRSLRFAMGIQSNRLQITSLHGLRWLRRRRPIKCLTSSPWSGNTDSRDPLRESRSA